MKVSLSSNDIIVTEHKSTVMGSEDAPPVENHVIIVDQNGENDVFVLLWGAKPADPTLVTQYELMWRGSWETCLKEYGDIVLDLAAEQKQYLSWLERH